MQDRERTPDDAVQTPAGADALQTRIRELEGERDRALAALRASEAQCADALADARRLQDISIELVRETGIGALHERILDAAMAIMDAQFGSMQLLHPARGDGGELELLTHRGFTAEAAEHWRWVDARSLGTCGRALAAGERAFIPDVEACTSLAGSDDLAMFRHTGIRAVQSTPLRARDGRLLGMLSTHWNRPHMPSDSELALIDALARQASDLIERWQAEAALHQAAGRDTFRLTLADALRTLGDPAEVQAVVTRLLAEHLDVDRVVYGEVAADGDTVMVATDACRRGAISVAGVHSIRAYGDYASETLLQGRALVEPDVLRQARVDEDERARHIAIGARAHINIPLFKAERLAAVLSVHQAAPREWSADEVAMVAEVADRAWTAVQRARAERALREQGALLQSVFAAAPIGVYTVDADFRIVMVNAVARPVFARIVDDVVGRDFGEVARLQREPAVAEEIIRAFRHVLASGDSWEVPEHARPHPETGATEYYEWRADRIVMPDGRFGVACFFRDITPQVRARQMVEDSRDALREADRRKDEFLATLAHELRNPLAPLRNGLYVLRMRDASPDPQELQIREVMERQVDVMVRLVDDLLEVSRITRGKIELRRRPVALEDVVAAALETSGPALQQAGHALEVALPDAPVVLDADPVRLAQVLGNLLNNAIKYTPAPGRIVLRARAADGTVEITIEDNGIGLSQELRAHVFDMFSQGDHTQAQGGLGIGLTLVRSLVELHGGSVEARSDGAGRGSVFVVRLPLPAHAGSVATDAAVPVPSQQRQSVLVVDDNRANADSLATLLRLAGNQVRTAYDGESCLVEVATWRPDVVLLDLGMPHVDGYEVCRRIRALPGGHRIAVLATTGWGQQADRMRSQESGFDAHLVKPVDPVALQVEMELARRARA